MVVPLFGWSAGDIVVSIRILYAIAKAFKESTGAEAQYLETSTWLKSFAGDLKRLNDYTREYPDAKYTKDLIETAGDISKHYEAFERYLRTYDKALSSSGKTNKVISAVKKIKWALKELKSHVETLKSAVSAPLLSVNFLFGLQLQNDFAIVADLIAHLPTSTRIEALENAFGQLTLQMDYLPNVQANIQRDMARVRHMIEEAHQSPALGVHHELLQAYVEATAQIISKLDGNHSDTTQALCIIRNSVTDLRDLRRRNPGADKLRSTQLEMLESLEHISAKSNEVQTSLKGLSKSLSALMDHRAENNKPGTVSERFFQAAATVTGIGLSLANIAYVKTSVDHLNERLPTLDIYQCPVNPDCTCRPTCVCGRYCSCTSGSTMETNEASSLSREFLQSPFNCSTAASSTQPAFNSSTTASSTQPDSVNYDQPIRSKLNEFEDNTGLENFPGQHNGPGRAPNHFSDTANRTSRTADLESPDQESQLQIWSTEYASSQVYSSHHHWDDNTQSDATLIEPGYSLGQHFQGYRSRTSRDGPSIYSLQNGMNSNITINDERLIAQQYMSYSGVEESSSRNMTIAHNNFDDETSSTTTISDVDLSGIGSSKDSTQRSHGRNHSTMEKPTSTRSVRRSRESHIHKPAGRY